MQTSVDGLARLKVYLAASNSCFPDDVKKLATVKGRIGMYANSVAQQCATDMHKQLLAWRPGKQAG